METVRSPQARPPPNAAVMDIHSPMDVDRGGSGAPPPQLPLLRGGGKLAPIASPSEIFENV